MIIVKKEKECKKKDKYLWVRVFVIVTIDQIIIIIMEEQIVVLAMVYLKIGGVEEVVVHQVIEKIEIVALVADQIGVIDVHSKKIKL